MSLILQPQKSFTVVRQIANHLDSDTLYVRAVVRNAYTDAIIDTLDLEDKGSQRFKKNWRVPADKSGEGFYISIVTSVYTDSNYTTKSPNYGDEENTYRVFNQINLGGGHGSLDSGRVRDIVQEENKKFLTKIKKLIPKKEKIDIPKQIDYQEKLDSLDSKIIAIQKEVQSLPKDHPSYEPILDVLEELSQEIQDKEVTPETDIDDLKDFIASLHKSHELDLEDIKLLFEKMNSTFPGIVQENVTEAVKSATPEVYKDAVFNIPMGLQPRQKEPEKKEEAPTVDLNKLAR